MFLALLMVFVAVTSAAQICSPDQVANCNLLVATLTRYHATSTGIDSSFNLIRYQLYINCILYFLLILNTIKNQKFVLQPSDLCGLCDLCASSDVSKLNVPECSTFCIVGKDACIATLAGAREICPKCLAASTVVFPTSHPFFG